jgi:hypothetical protein
LFQDSFRFFASINKILADHAFPARFRVSLDLPEELYLAG